MWNRNKLQACGFCQQTTQNLIINAFIHNCHHQVGDQVTSTSEITQLLWLLKLPLLFPFAQDITLYAEDNFLALFYCSVQWFIYFDVVLAGWKPPFLKTLINNQRATSKITTPLTTTTKLNKSQHVRSINKATLREPPKQFRKKGLLPAYSIITMASIDPLLNMIFISFQKLVLSIWTRLNPLAVVASWTTNSWQMFSVRRPVLLMESLDVMSVCALWPYTWDPSCPFVARSLTSEGIWLRALNSQWLCSLTRCFSPLSFTSLERNEHISYRMHNEKHLEY